MPRRPAVLGLAAALLFWFWQFLTVRYNYGGNWTGLFCIGDRMKVPAVVPGERSYIFAATYGYDGQFYHLMAHDPWMRRGFATAIDSPAFRYRRILVPALAWILALGNQRWIDAAYFTVILGFAFLGVYWLAQFASRSGLHPAWGLAFVLTPATITSLDRMLSDIALAALAVAFALYAAKGPRWALFLVLACAPMARETALPLIAGYSVFLLTRRRFADCAWIAAAMLPAVAWFAFVMQRLQGAPASLYMGWIPLEGFVDRLFHPILYPLPPAKNALVVASDYAALAGVALALIAAAALAGKRRWDALASAVYGLALFVIFLRGASVWETPYAFGRVLTPFLLLTALADFATRPWLALAPIFLIDPDIGLSLSGQIIGVVRGLTGL